MKRFLTRWYLLNKRLFKKPVFILILCSVPILILALNMVTAGAEGFVEIALAMENPEDAIALRCTDELIGSSDIVHFTLCDSPEEAQEQVRNGDADGAWIFSSDVAGALDRLAHNRVGGACVKVIEREETVALRLSREKLAAVLSSDSCFALMCSAYAERVSPDYDEAELRGYFERAVGADDIFEFRYASGELADFSDSSYLMLPIRGVLAAAILLCGFAMAMFWIRDDERKVFCRVSPAARPAFELGYHLTGIIDIAVVVLISLYASGLGLSLLREIVNLAVYVLCCAAFVILIRRLLRRAGSVAAITPMVIVVVIVVNPILFNLPLVYPVRVLTPVFYYLQATHNPSFILYGLLYFAVVAAIDYALYLLEDKLHFRSS